MGQETGWGLGREARVTLAVVGALALLGLGMDAARAPAAQAPPTAEVWEAALRQARQVDVNAAGVAELERLPGIGPALAARIVAERKAHGPFSTVEELQRVRGIGPKTQQALEEYITVQ